MRILLSALALLAVLGAGSCTSNGTTGTAGSATGPASTGTFAPTGGTTSPAPSAAAARPAATTPSPASTPASAAPGGAAATTLALAPAASKSVTPAAAAPIPAYRLNPYDTVEVTIFEVPDLNRTVQVSDQGQIDLPLIGAVPAGGKSVTEVKAEVAQRYGARYINNPTVSVSVKEYTSQKVTVEGSVTGPGVYPIPGGATLLQVIAMAKGVSRVGDTSGVMVFRNQGGQRLAALFDLEAIRAGKAADPTLIGGDIVVVPESAARAAWQNVRESIGVMGFFSAFML